MMHSMYVRHGFEALKLSKNRLSIDYDNLDYWDVYGLVDRLRCDGFKPTIYRTRNGYHIECPLPKRLPLMSLFKLRRDYLDDRQRIDYDMRRISENWPIDVLFQNRRDNSPTRYETVVP